MGLKGDKRRRMYDLPPSQKAYLLQQSVNPSFVKTPGQSVPSHAASYGPSSSSALLPRLVPQLTGDAGIMRRFSISGWGGATTAPPVVSSESSGSSSHFDSNSPGRGTQKMVDEVQAIQPQTTSGLWSNWWTSSGGEKSGVKETSAKWYVDVLRNSKFLDRKLAKHLLSLRVHLSTVNLVWIEDFLDTEKGFDALATLLASLVGNAGKRRELNEIGTSILLDVIKCIRILANTDVS